MLTPFHRLALAARHAAFKNEPLKPARASSKLLREQDSEPAGDVGRACAAARGLRALLRPRLLAGRPRDQARLRPERAHGDAGRTAPTSPAASTAFPTRDLAGTPRGRWSSAIGRPRRQPFRHRPRVDAVSAPRRESPLDEVVGGLRCVADGGAGLGGSIEWWSSRRCCSRGDAGWCRMVHARSCGPATSSSSTGGRPASPGAPT